MLTGADPGLILGSCKILQKKLEHRNDAICRIIIDSGNTNCLGTWMRHYNKMRQIKRILL